MFCRPIVALSALQKKQVNFSLLFRFNRQALELSTRVDELPMGKFREACSFFRAKYHLTFSPAQTI